jgi:acyl-coenzyme A synthetase/AMP-(fatty) acid ligase
MIKAGAHRVGPQEIEQVIEKLPEVAECGVVGVPDPLDGEAIAAYALPVPGAGLDEQQVRKICFDHLPRYKLPTHVRIVSEMPRTESGKLRRAGLRQWFAEESAAVEEA